MRYLQTPSTMTLWNFMLIAHLCQSSSARLAHAAAYRWTQQMGEETIQKDLYGENNSMRQANEVTSNWPFWISYPPPVPLWAISKPRREFRPFFGMFTVTTSPPPITPSPPSSQPLQSDCRPDTLTGNLPLSCIVIIQALRDNDVDTVDSEDMFDDV
eukprot:GFUD01031748.1.p1 GENE.GFUD01031748.1~~GFUD01031748.1.p1  ORF type:complete len:157 (-),score=38.08 GFUD01031748.1:70-540(-)